ncbi:hypothetical protein AB9E29_07055 [Rhizobium leguminosarum]|uniref:hypothetical protein n=1 Tax=Rhizobium leguminosarum TaxID=384 RepID=UPI003F94A62B
MAAGRCALTLLEGKFVECHIFPRALTRPADKGKSFLQIGEDTKQKRRWSSWYDPKLVTRAGEDILADLDDWAIKFMRSKRLVWSGWGPEIELNDHPIWLADFGARVIEVDDPDRFRLFLLSILWRAAATKLEEFNEIDIPANDLELLRVSVLTGKLPSVDFYPASLSQIRTLGMKHNQSPTLEEKFMPSVQGTPERNIPIFRFYFDGLIIHFHKNAVDHEAKTLGPFVVGNENRITISTFPFENSRQRNDLIARIASLGL